MGVVYYANHFIWFEIGRAEFLRAAGIPYLELEKRGIFTPVAEAYCKYKTPARYDELIEVDTSIVALKGARIRFEYEIRHHDTGVVIAEGYTVMAFVDRQGRPIAIEVACPDVFEKLRSVVTESRWGAKHHG
ncbi:MAG TPA: acyl-CoA thioesterase [Firmicutes bacterium]|nr:acyl-CoA thioesterase [Bacillota bacterium]